MSITQGHLKARIKRDGQDCYNNVITLAYHLLQITAVDIDGLAGEEGELAVLVEFLDKASTAYGMEISAEKTKLITASVASTQRSD